MMFPRPTSSFFRTVQFNCMTRNFNITRPVALRALFAEEDQKKIINYLNDVFASNVKTPKGIQIPKKVKSVYSEKGPLQDINDLLEKYHISSPKAVNLCYSVLKFEGQAAYNPKDTPVLTRQKKYHLGRKLKSLQKSITPLILDPQAIRKFTVVTVSDETVSFVVFESQEMGWKSQNVIDWSSIDVTNLSLSSCIIRIWNSIQPDDVFVVHNIPSKGNVANTKGGRPLSLQSRLFGAAWCALCGKCNYKDIERRIFEISGTAPQRHFNLFVGNELVSPLHMLSMALERRKDFTPDDHVLLRSLGELNFSNDTQVKFSEFEDNMKESISHCLVVGKAFVEILKACND